jgi:hypothetical protein
MKKTKIESTIRLAAFAAALTVSAWAQSGPVGSGNPASPHDQDPSYGQLGDSYFEFDAGYQSNASSPGALHDYGIVSNTNLEKGNDWGIDGNFNYDYLTGGAYGFHDYRNEPQFGVTTYLSQFWGRPFVNGDFGWAWERDGGESHNSYAYTGMAGIEFQVLKPFVLTPFVEYQAEPNMHIDSPSAGDLPNHLWDTGVKGTYRLTQQLSASLGVDLDQYKASDWGYKAGVAFHF